LLVRRSFAWKVEKRRSAFRQNLPLRRGGQGANSAGSDIDAED
jgi:hypothetical protein